MKHYLLDFVKNIQGCPYCNRDGKYAEVVWDLHPENRKYQNINDRLFGYCHNGHEIWINVRPYIFTLGNETDKEELDAWGNFAKH